MGAGQLYSLCPNWTEAIAGDMERWAFQFASVRSIEQAREVVEQAREEVSRRARRARKHAAAAIQALDAPHVDDIDNGADETDNGADDSHEAQHEGQQRSMAAPDALHASRSPAASPDGSASVAASTAGTRERDSALGVSGCAPFQGSAAQREHHQHQQHHSHRQHHQCHHGQHHQTDARSTSYFAPTATNAASSTSALASAASAAAAASLAAPSMTPSPRRGEDDALQPLDARLLPDGSVQLSTSIGAWRLSARRLACESGIERGWACNDAPAAAPGVDTGSAAAAAVAAALNGVQARDVPCRLACPASCTPITSQRLTCCKGAFLGFKGMNANQKTALAASDDKLSQLSGDDPRVTSFVHLLSEFAARAPVPSPRETQLVDQMEQIIEV
eukprot:6188854-Pleurochrysis_carterae.AAC.1